jgi:hypothetical protein
MSADSLDRLRTRTAMIKTRILLISLGALSLGAMAMGDPYAYTNWNSTTALSADGTITLDDASVVNVHYSGEVASPTQINNTGIHYWETSKTNTDTSGTYRSAAIDNGPNTADIIALTGVPQMVYTVTFDRAVDNVAMDLLSVGQDGTPIQYDFSSDFTLENSGPGYWGDGTLAKTGTNLLGVEGHGVILFHGPTTSISWTVEGTENWHGFQVGTVTPEPAPMVALGLGIVAVVRRRRRKV